MPSEKGPSERILIVRLSHLGDVVCALPVFHALRESRPGAEIAWVVQPEFAGLLEGMPGLARIIPFGRRKGWRAWRRLRAELGDFRPDLVVDAQGNLKSAAAVWCAGAPRRAGLNRADWRERLGALVLNDPAPPVPSRARHAIDRMLALARHVAPEATAPPRTDPALSEAERAAGAARLDERLPLAARGDWILHLAAPADVRSWPGVRWGELAEHLLEAGRRVLLLSGQEESELGRALERELGARDGLAHWIGQDGLRELAAVFDAAARRGLVLVCCDSGPMHLACACGLDPIVLEGPQEARCTGPWTTAGARAERVVRAADGPSCAPCRSRRCTHADGPVCMSRITAPEVARIGGAT
ncbi:MAG: glycosyltransferase family 9 protein [Planctomycetota bacterium]|nr:glycosyltransferase family 9 protein [Planctomycetota bacterium]